jgi:hypothetical protein
MWLVVCSKTKNKDVAQVACSKTKYSDVAGGL